MKRTTPLIIPLTLIWLVACSHERPPDADSAGSLFRDVSISAPLGSSQIPTTAIDRRTGTSYVVFFRAEGTINNLYLSSLESGTNQWSEPVRVNSTDGDVSPHAQAPAQVVVGPGGNVYVVWANAIPVEGRRFPASNLFIAGSVDGGQSFTEQKAINSDAGGLPAGHTFHDVTVAPDGRILVTWLDSRRREARATPGEVRPESPEVTDSEIWLAISHDQGETFRETTIAKNTCQCCRTSVVVGPDGRIHLAWRHVFPDGSRDMVVSVSDDDGASFSEPARIHADGWKVDGCPHSGPSLAVDTAGNVHVAWYTGAKGHEGLYYASAGSDLQFSSPTPLVTSVPVSQVKLGGSGSDAVWLAWEEQPTRSIRMAHASRNRGLIRVDDPALKAHSPAIAVGLDRLVIVGQQGSDTQVFMASLPSGSTSRAQNAGGG